MQMLQAFDDNSSTKWKQGILAMLKQTPIRLSRSGSQQGVNANARYQMNVTLAQAAGLRSRRD
jgi:hypothetical protein